MPTRRGVLQALICLPLAARRVFADDPAKRAIDDEGVSHSGRGLACALGEDADASGLPPARRDGESIALALSGTPRPAAERLRELTGSVQTTWVELSALDRASVDDGALAEKIRTAASVSLIEGNVLDWLNTLWPAHRGSAVLGALNECAATGGRVIGRGSTAMLLAAGGVVRGPTRDEAGESRPRLSNPRESGEPRLTQGLRLCGDFFIDTQARSAGSVLRLLSTLIEGHDDHGVYLGARSALCCDLETRSWVALGQDPLIVVDLTSSRRLAESIEGAHISVLTAKDGWRARERRLFSTGASVEFGVAAKETSDVDGLLARNLLATPSESRSWRDARARVNLRQGTDSLAFTGPNDAPARAQRMLLDVALEHGRWGELGP